MKYTLIHNTLQVYREGHFNISQHAYKRYRKRIKPTLKGITLIQEIKNKVAKCSTGYFDAKNGSTIIHSKGIKFIFKNKSLITIIPKHNYNKCYSFIGA